MRLRSPGIFHSPYSPRLLLHALKTSTKYTWNTTFIFQVITRLVLKKHFRPQFVAKEQHFYYILRYRILYVETKSSTPKRSTITPPLHNTSYSLRRPFKLTVTHDYYLVLHTYSFLHLCPLAVAATTERATSRREVNEIRREMKTTG